MGYYTDYSLALIEGSEDEYASFLKELAQIAEEPEIENECVCAKWYEYEEDMEELTEKYPNLLIEIECIGEDGETWYQRFRNGESETVHPIIPPFKKLLSSDGK